MAELNGAFADLRFSTAYFRRLGRVALRQSPERTRFDRVADQPRARKAAPVPPKDGTTPTPPPAKQEEQVQKN